ncbi:Uncharacterised protein [Chlamydia trachomatis]|nr:Uncharacterised protein [Chlamydia trachomatis]
MFEADHPRVQRVLHKLQRLLLNIGKRGFFEVTDHVRRDTENAGDFVDLKLPRLQKLCLFWADGDGRVFHALFQYRDLVAVPCAAERRLPRLPNPSWILDRARMLQHTTRCRAVGKERCAVVFGSLRQADGVLGHRNRAVANQPIEAEPWNMQHLVRGKLHGFEPPGRFIPRTLILVIQPSSLITSDRHPVWHERIQADDLVAAVTDHLSKRITPEQ